MYILDIASQEKKFGPPLHRRMAHNFLSPQIQRSFFFFFFHIKHNMFHVWHLITWEDENKCQLTIPNKKNYLLSAQFPLINKTLFQCSSAPLQLTSSIQSTVWNGIPRPTSTFQFQPLTYMSSSSHVVWLGPRLTPRPSRASHSSNSNAKCPQAVPCGA